MSQFQLRNTFAFSAGCFLDFSLRLKAVFYRKVKAKCSQRAQIRTKLIHYQTVAPLNPGGGFLIYSDTKPLRMTLSRKLFPFIKDFLLQSIVFFICFISPYGGASFHIGKFNESILHDILNGANDGLLQVLWLTFEAYMFAIIYGFLPGVINYLSFSFISKNHNYYSLKVIVALFAGNISYIFLWMYLNTVGFFLNLLFPVFTTMVLYAIYKFYKLRNVKPGNA